ncbi:MAG: hypothetical protein NC311_13005 [Muribaculaceae bacterium]|nr:hypothetical protein [Muribaculaceae bacterium]
MKKLRCALGRYSVELMVGMYLIYSLYINRADAIYGYVNAWYVINYSYGFGSRLLVGSLVSLLTGGFVTKTFAYNFVLAALGTICILLALVIGSVYKKMPDRQSKAAVLFLAVFYLMSPASPEYLWTAENMGRLDTYLFLLSLVAIIVFFHIKDMRVRYVLFAALGCLCILIHQAYVFLFFPLVLVMMIEDIWDNDKKRRYIFCGIFVLAVVGIVFLIMQFTSGIYYDNLELLMEDLNSRADFLVDEGPMEAEYFWTIVENFTNNMVPEIPHHLKYGFMLVCMLSPVWVTYLWIWIHAVRHSRKKDEKVKYVLMLMTNLAFVPVFALMNDWGRWFAALFIVGFLDILVLAWKRDEGIRDSLKTLGGGIVENPAPYILLVLYISTFEKFEGLNFPEQVTSFYYTTYDIKCWLLDLFR